VSPFRLGYELELMQHTLKNGWKYFLVNRCTLLEWRIMQIIQRKFWLMS